MGTALVTGANGFVGSHICEALIASGYEVKALVRKTSDLTNIKNLNVKLAYGDLNQPETLPDALQGVDFVINNAGLTKTLDNSQFIQVNAIGTRNILQAIQNHAPNIKRFVLISSTAASGPSSSMTPITEDHDPGPLTFYGKSKLQGEKEALSFNSIIPITILRPSAIYGPRDKEMLSFFKAVKGKLKPTFGYGDSYINFTYVKDLAGAVVKSLSVNTPSGEIFFVTEKKAYSYSQAGDIVAEIFGVKAYDLHIPLWLISSGGKISEIISKIKNEASILTYDKAKEFRAKYWLVDSSKLEKQLGFVCPTDFKSGSIETIEWYRKLGML